MSREPIPIPIVTMDATTGQPVEAQATGTAFMLPAREGTCETCAKAHEPELPHNAQSLFYQMRFQIENGRSASWIDAMAHCDEPTRQLWTEHLERLGVDVAGGAVNPAKPR